jgi:hypothetical protein
MRQGVVELSIPDQEVVAPKVLRRLGHPPPLARDDRILLELQRVLEQARPQICPRSLYRMTPLLSWESGVLAGRDIRIRSAKWAALMGRLVKPEILCCFVVTLGVGLDRMINHVQSDSLFRAYILDAFGAVVAEHLAEQMEQRLSELLGNQGYEITARLSPGYCDWELREGQEALFRFLQPEVVGVHRTRAGTMTPRKSVSAALVGARATPVKSPCLSCSAADCPYRMDHGTDKNDP